MITRFIFSLIISLLTFFSTAQAFPQLNPFAGNHVTALPHDEMEQLESVYSHINRFYIRDVTDKKLFENAMEGMLANLDPHSSYLNKEEMEKLKSTADGKFGGIGIEIIPDKIGALRVISPIDDTPAKKAGIKPGDLIIRINGDAVQDMTLQEAVTAIRGEPGTKVKLLIIREGTPKPINLEVERAIIHVQSVKSRMLPDSYGYVRISFFQEPVKESIIAAIKKLKHESNGKLKGIVLDLRGNPGGLLGPAIDTADLFLDSKKLKKNKLIVYTKGRLKQLQVRAEAEPGDIASGLPMVVLINVGSASGSEIVAGALQDHHRALILGKKSFGKGSVQTVFPITKDSAIKLTTALYYTPNGRSIQAEGIVPDITVPDLEVKYPESNDFDFLTESSLGNHLMNGNIKKFKAKMKARKKTLKEMQKLSKEDYQLYEAVNALRAQGVR